MNQQEKEFIDDNIKLLNSLITWNVSVRSELLSKRILSEEVMQIIDSEKTPIQRSNAFILAMKAQTNGFKNLLSVLIETRQTGAADALRNFNPSIPSSVGAASSVVASSSVSNSTPLTQSANNTWRVSFNGRDVVHDVLPTVQSDLVRGMTNEIMNTTIISEIISLKYFDRTVAAPILNNPYADQQKRMNDLFQLLVNLEDREIECCLETLCNLKGYPRAAEKFRSILAEHFTDCIQKA